MLDSEGFVKAGWVHDLKLYQFKTSSGNAEKCVAMAKLRIIKHYG